VKTFFPNLRERKGRNANAENTRITGYKDTVLLYNPRAGRFDRRGTGLLERLVEILKNGGHRLTTAPTTGPNTAGPIARAHIDRGADLIVVAGGDGTINEVAEGMVGTAVPLAILPAGTANVLAMELKLGRKPEKAAATLGGLHPRRIALGRISGRNGSARRHFLCMAGAGLDAHIVYHVNAGLKSRTGKFAYWIAGWSLFGRKLPQMRVEVDGAAGTCSFALISKVRNYGGDFEIAREVTLYDDRFEAVLFEGRSSVRYVKYFAGMALGRLAGMKGVTMRRASRVRLSCPEDERMYVQIDGEYAGHLPVDIDIVPDALTLLVPPGYGR
jgi:diacylglycerol kinase (ATP)